MELPKKETLTDMIQAELDKVGKNQVELAHEIGIDPSTLNRHINEKTNTSYERMREIQEVLQEWKSERRQPAAELMTEGFTSTTLSETRREAAAKMQDGAFSQLPVRETKEGEVVGIVTDTDLMKIHDDGTLIDDVEFQHIIKVDKDTDRRLIEEILDQRHPAVLVVDDGSPVGIITRADLLDSTPG